MNKLHARRLRAEARFMRMCRGALITALLILALLLGTLLWRGVPGFVDVQLRLPITFALAPQPGEALADVPVVRYMPLGAQALQKMFPGRRAAGLLSPGVGMSLRTQLVSHPEWLNTTQYVWVPASGAVLRIVKNHLPMDAAGLSAAEQAALQSLQAQGAVRQHFDTWLLSRGDSRNAEQAGFFGAVAGSLLAVFVCIAFAFPLGVMTAVYLQEFAPRGRFAALVEVNINNLAAVPSIVFGLLGLAVYINVMGLPRSTPLVGGLTLALMVLPVIIIATRTALAAVPDSIRHGALALGASPLQATLHHALPLAMPGIMTGTILAIARALGETAPLLMIGMVAFVADVPHGFTDPATTMPVQIYLWAGSPESGFAEKTAAGILVLLAVLLALNAAAIYIRKKFEVRW